MSLAVAKPNGMRIAALLLFLGLPVVLVAMTALNMVQMLDDRFAIADKENQLAALKRRLDAPARPGNQPDMSALYLTGASSALASANLQQQLVAAIAVASGRVIETLSVDPADPTEDTGLVRLKATLDIANEGLLDLLYGLETGVPLITVETLSIRRSQNREDDAGTDMLRVDMMVNAQQRPWPAP